MTVLVLDIGTSSARALLFDAQARPIPGALVQHKYQINTEPPGAATLDAEELRGIVEVCVDNILSHSAAKTISAVGIATLVGNLLGMDRDGKPITPVYLYSDTRSADDVKLLRQQVNTAESHQRTGCPLHTAYHTSRLHFLARTEPQSFEQTAFWTDFGTYLYSQWFKQDAPCSYSVASWSGLLNRQSLRWDDEWLSLLRVPEKSMPPLADYDRVHVGLHSSYRSRWSALNDAPFCLAVGDGGAANIGMGCCDKRRVALSVGTTAALRVALQSATPPHVPTGLWGYRIAKDLHLLGGATSEGGNLHRWARETLQLPPDFMHQLMDCPVDQHGLTVLPLLAGERSPGWSLDATGSIVGIRLSTTPLDIAQAMFEGLALRLSLIYEQLGDYIDAETQIIANGGALSSYVAQIIADALDHALHITAETEITSRGAALLALKAMGDHTQWGVPPEIANIIHPRPEAAVVLRQARVRQTELYHKMIEDSRSQI